MTVPTARAEAITLRTYCREQSDGLLEPWSRVNQRAVVEHQARLWEGAGGVVDLSELTELAQLGVDRKSTVAGRALWLGGTEYAATRPCCNFNCAASAVYTVYDVVDVAWLLLNGSGVGFKPQVGVLHGYNSAIRDVVVVPSERDKGWKGRQENSEEHPKPDNGYTWTIRVGDSAQAWAKAIGKLFMCGSRGARRLVLDFSDVRGPGGRIKGYGWICNGYSKLATAMLGIHSTLNRKAGQLLDEIDIMDSLNRVGEILSSRRSAECCVIDSNNPVEHEFAEAKREYWTSNPHRRQSNNSELFWSKPSRRRLLELLHQLDECGGDPGIVNAESARVKAPWFEYFNPCFEIFLGAFCNLVNNCLPRFRRDFGALERAVHLIARANYRQTCVDMRDGVLQPRWHQANESLRLCGVSLTGIVQAPWMTDYKIRRLRDAAVYGAYSMADELGLPRPKAVTTVTPAGTISKVMGGVDVGEIAEGVHNPIGRYVFNWVNFSVHDPIIEAHRSAGYRVMRNPQDSANDLVCFPVEFHGGAFEKRGGREVNAEPAIAQLERYLRWNTLWADHNVSCTVSYSPDEIPGIADWLDKRWYDGYIATAFMRRVDAEATPESVGHPYLPQEVVTPERYSEYASSLRPVDYSCVRGTYDVEETSCVRGVCPSR